MSAESLCQALHDTVDEQVALDDPLSTLEIIGALEQVKFDLQMAFTEPDDDDDDEACQLAA